MENIIWNSERQFCENCNGHPSVRMKTKNKTMIITPQCVTTPFGGELCGTGCAMSWINKKVSTLSLFPLIFCIMC